MSQGIDIGFYKTQACSIKKISPTKFKIILTEGKNRQIIRMCLKLGFKVLALKRTRIDKFYLSDLQSNTFKLTKI